MSAVPRDPLVSVIVPARHAAASTAQALDSLFAQTSQAWEVVVIHGGSADATDEIARAATRSPRVRVITPAPGGGGGARNTGIAHARGEWLLFLEADDWLAPTAVERFAAAAAPDVDAVLAGWGWVTADGTTMRDPLRPDTTDLFPTLARLCPFPSHACLVRKTVATAAGGFEPGLTVGTDWDFWQRVARAGARFATVDEVLAFRRVGPWWATIDIPEVIEAGRRLIALGHGPDPRVKAPAPRYAAGMPRDEVPGALLHFICWPAGILIGHGGDATAVLAAVSDATDLELEPSMVAHALYLAALLPESRPQSAWPAMWTAAVPCVDAFLAALERQSGTRSLATRTKRVLEHLVLAQSDECRPRTVGATLSTPIELTRPITDVTAEAGVQIALARLFLEGEPLGTVELPVCDGVIPGAVLADAVAEHFAWQILGRFFGRGVYRALATRQANHQMEVWRGSVKLTDALPSADEEYPSVLHDAVGWAVFLQEFWGEPSRPGEWFYDAASDNAHEPPVNDGVGVTPLLIEGSAPLVAHRATGDHAVVDFRIGGIPVARVTVPADQGVVRPAAVRAQCTAAAGYELCRIAVREGILGQPLDAPGGLRERLADAAARARRYEGPTRVPSWVEELGILAGTLVCLRRAGPVGTSVSRRAVLPSAAAAVCREAAAAAGEGVVSAPHAVARVAYAPEVFDGRGPADGHITGHQDSVVPDAHDSDPDTAGFDRHYFETLFASTHDPWSHATPYEQLKYEQTIALIVSTGRTERVLELACAEGIFTQHLAPRVGELLATDLTQIAVDRTAVRCADLQNVTVRRLDIVTDPIPAGYDTIVCNEVLYYLGGRAAVEAVARKLAAALPVGGCIVTAHSNVVDGTENPGFDWDVPIGARGIGEVFAATPGLSYRTEIRTPFYRIQLFRRVGSVEATVSRLLSSGPPTRPQRVEEAPWVHPAPHVAARFRMQGGSPSTGGVPTTATHALPILMYHSVSPQAWPAFARYRMTPATFEEQLRYLRDAGFRSVTLEEWRVAKARWTPLPGRAVMLTFDDGFRDFAEYAWPLLRRYGFGASVFLVTDHVGGTNVWDAAYGDPAPLLDWDTVRQLRAEGVEFGSHTATHPFLTAHPPADVACELSRSRAAFCRELGTAPTALAYPHGGETPAVQHLAGAVGYLYGLSTRPGRSQLTDPLLALRRIEVRGTDGLCDFIKHLS